MTAALKPDYTKLPVGMVAFPHRESVFVPDQVGLGDHLLPLFTIDLHTVNPDWAGDLHMLSPMEPYEGLVGDLTEGLGIHTPMLLTNWIGFTIEKGRYRLCGDSRFFYLHEANADLPEVFPGVREELLHHYENQHKAYAKAKEHFLKTQVLVDTTADAATPVPFVDRLGGALNDNANWVQLSAFPLEAGQRPGTIHPVSPAGNQFQHVASVPGWRYSCAGADMIILFYEPVEGLVLFTFDWS